MKGLTQKKRIYQGVTATQIRVALWLQGLSEISLNQHSCSTQIPFSLSYFQPSSFKTDMDEHYDFCDAREQMA